MDADHRHINNSKTRYLLLKMCWCCGELFCVFWSKWPAVLTLAIDVKPKPLSRLTYPRVAFVQRWYSGDDGSGVVGQSLVDTKRLLVVLALLVVWDGYGGEWLSCGQTV